MRTISLPALQGMLAQQTDEWFAVLLDIDHPSFQNPIRLVNDYNVLQVDGNTYMAYPFEFTLPDEQDDREPQALLIIDNTDRMLVSSIRSISGPPTITARIVRGKNPSDIEWGPIDFTVRSVQYDASYIRFRLVFLNYSDEPFPYLAFTPRLFPGLFS